MAKPLSPFITEDQHFSRLMYEVKGGLDNVCIATYNIYAGIGAGGKDLTKGRSNKVREFLNLLKKSKKVKILVGLPKKHPAESDNDFRIRKQRLLDTTKHFPSFDWRFVTDSHLKCYVFEKRKSICCISGGRNLSDSKYTDVSFVVPRKAAHKIKSLFSRVFTGAKKITKRNLKL